MVLGNRLSPLAVGSISSFLKRGFVKEGIGWLTHKDVKTSDHFENLSSVQKNMVKMKQETSMIASVETELEHLNSRMFQAEMNICHKFQLLKTILTNQDSSEKSTTFEVEQLRNGILDTNSGVLSNLSVINQILVGETVTNSAEKGLLERWSQGFFNNMCTNQISAKAYLDYVTKYFDKFALLQYKGLLLFTGANTNSHLCLDQYHLLRENLVYQNELIENTLPNNIEYLTDPDEQNVFIIRPVLDNAFEPFIKRKCRQKILINDFFNRNNEDGKWMFEKSKTFDHDGSLYISGSQNEKKCTFNYIKVSESKNAELAKKDDADSFYVIPRDSNETRMKIVICRTIDNYPCYLSHCLNFSAEYEDVEFTMTKQDTTVK